ncbi:hypothetical protein CBR_g8933 [Chara braunii]|uniref:Uncharacterized protein n=1 Tax=Chara braunii TaxID=69332 RepID=A0A388KN79_CHABU|nr:hypothetical protein CBR_g8933 [Chara braunii]|eukprot:GBG71516.1 hypothetical protein CBR_g8933 [Chara braunii]
MAQGGAVAMMEAFCPAGGLAGVAGLGGSALVTRPRGGGGGVGGMAAARACYPLTSSVSRCRLSPRRTTSSSSSPLPASASVAALTPSSPSASRKAASASHEWLLFGCAGERNAGSAFRRFALSPLSHRVHGRKYGGIALGGGGLVRASIADATSAPTPGAGEPTKPTPATSAAPVVATPTTAPPPPWQGASMKPLIASILTGVIVWMIPAPAGVARNAWQLLAIFLATIVGIITQPLPLGAVALMGLGASVLTRTLSFAAAFSAFGDPIPWLIALAFFFARGFIKTGLGNRVAYKFVSMFGKTTLGLSYSLVFSEAFLAPAIPSVSARAGGIFLPLVKALCLASGSRVGDGTERKLGAYLMLTCFQTSVISSAMFLTGMAANPLSVNLAAGAIGHAISWTEWAMAGLVPGLIGLLVIPSFLYVIYPPEIKASPDAPRLAQENLKKMGPMTREEKIMAATLVCTVGLWIFGSSIKVDAVTAAIAGLSVLLVTGVVTWKECLGEGVAWDTLTWFAALIAMANYLNKYGLIAWFSQSVVKVVGGLGLPWQPAFGILVLLYFYSHYFFASGAAHIGAMFTAFLSVATALGTPPLFGALVLCFVSNLMGGLTHYGIGSAPVFYGAGYVPLSKWWTYGFICSVLNLVIWLGAGSIWWNVLGLIR